MTRFTLMFCLLPTIASPLRAASDEPVAAPEWEFIVAPYLWMVGIDGDVEADGHTADIDISFSDIWDDLDVAVLTALEARRGKLSITSNLIYMKISPVAGRPVGPLLPIAPPGSFDVRVTTQSASVELYPAWEVLSLPLFGAADERRIAVDVGPGARAFWLDTHVDVKLQPGVPVGPFQSRFDESVFWVDLVGAVRVRAQLTENIGLVVSGSYGGFDIGSSSHRTWSIAAFAAYRLSDHWDLDAGWRTLSIERGAVDIDMAGPLIGASYRF